MAGQTSASAVRGSARLWGLWIVASTLGYLAAAWLFLNVVNLSAPVGYRGDALVLGNAVAWMGGGLLLGFPQYMVLREVVPDARRWILMTTLGWIFALPAGQIFGAIAYGWVNFTLVAYIAVGWGAVLGFFQWTTLRDTLKWAGWWIAASALGWLLGLPAVARFIFDMGLLHAPSAGWQLRFLLGVGIAGALIGAVTGVALVALLGRDEQRLAAPTLPPPNART